MALFLIIWIWSAVALPNPDQLIPEAQAQSTKIYDNKKETILYEIYSEKRRTAVELENIPDYVKWATITIEDKDFYKHKGFSLRGLARAILTNILRRRTAQGGSTITQQLIKNAILTPERTYTRKIKELILAWRLEQKFTKDEILKLYLNEIPYGSTAYGIEAAAKTYFGKSASELSLAEGALLTAIPKAATFYSPYGEHTDKLKARQEHILSEMAKEGYITEEEADLAKRENVLSKIAPKKESMIAPHFVLYVKELLAERYGERIVEQGGLTVVTSLDLEKQLIAEEAVKKGAERNQEKYGGTNAALVAIDPKTGRILAMVGSRDWTDDEHDGKVNVALRPRQPGSSFKPVVYSAAFIKGYTPNTVVYDVVTDFPTLIEGTYTPTNYDEKEYGPITLRKALAGSLNISGVKLTYLTGLDNIIDLAEKMGYATFQDRSRFGLSLVLGGGEVKLLEHTNAFATLANEGVYREPQAILRIEDAEGNTIEENKPNEGGRALDEEIARLTTGILSDNAARAFAFGERNYLTLPDRPVAAKTGTTNDFRDAWTIGFTPSLAAGVWAGNNDNTPMRKAPGSVAAAPIWNEFMAKALAGTPAEQFAPPQPIITGKPILDGEEGGLIKVTIDKISGKLATEFTPPEFRMEKTFTLPHSILFYVDKDNPRGPAPKHPEDDPHYEAWEKAIQKWAQKNNVALEEPPTEYDTTHTIENRPTLTINSPEHNELITEPKIRVGISAGAKRKLSKIKYYIDDELITIAHNFQSQLDLALPPFLKNGFHTLKIEVLDDVGNYASAARSFNLALDSPPKAAWLSPAGGSIVSPNEQVELKLGVADNKNIAKSSFSYSTSGGEYLIGTVLRPEQKIITVPWRPIYSGAYQIVAEINEKDGNSFKTPALEIIVK